MYIFIQCLFKALLFLGTCFCTMQGRSIMSFLFWQVTYLPLKHWNDILVDSRVSVTNLSSWHPQHTFGLPNCSKFYQPLFFNHLSFSWLSNHQYQTILRARSQIYLPKLLFSSSSIPSKYLCLFINGTPPVLIIHFPFHQFQLSSIVALSTLRLHMWSTFKCDLFHIFYFRESTP